MCQLAIGRYVRPCARDTGMIWALAQPLFKLQGTLQKVALIKAEQEADRRQIGHKQQPLALEERPAAPGSTFSCSKCGERDIGCFSRFSEPGLRLVKILPRCPVRLRRQALPFEIL